jgi:hypothetical protein
MTPRHSRRFQENLHVGIAAENVRTLIEPDAAVRPFQQKRDFATAARARASRRALSPHEKHSKPVQGGWFTLEGGSPRYLWTLIMSACPQVLTTA